MASKKEQSFLKGTLILTISTVIVKIIGALFKIPIGRILGGVGNSYFEAAYALYNPIDVLAVAGLPAAISRMVSVNAAKKKFKDVKLIHKISVPIFLATGTIGFILMAAGTFYYVKLINSPGAAYATFALAPTILFSCLMSIYRGYYQGLKNMTPTALSEIIEASCKLIVGLGLAKAIIFWGMKEYKELGTVFGCRYLNQSLAEDAILPFAAGGAIIGITLGAFLGFIFLALYYKKVGDGISTKALYESKPSIKTSEAAKLLIKIALPIGASAFIMNLAGLVDTVVIRCQLSRIVSENANILLSIYENNIPSDKILNKEVHDFLSGCFGYVSGVVMLLPGIAQVFGITALSTVSDAFSKGNKKKLQKNVESIIRLTAIFVIPGGIGLAVMGGPILSLLYGAIRGQEVNIATRIISVMGIASIFTAMSAPVCSMLQAIGQIKLPLMLTSIGVIAKVLINYILVGIPEINIQGAGIGTLVCYSFVLVFSLRSLCKHVGLKLDIGLIFIKPFVAAICCASAGYTTFNMLCFCCDSRLSTIIAIAVSVLIYVLSLMALGAIDLNSFKILQKEK